MVFIVSALVLFAALSLKGMQPWDIDQRWAAHFQALSCIALAAIVVMLRDHTRNANVLPFSRAVSGLGLVAIIAGYSVNAYRQSSYYRYEADQLVYELENIAQHEISPPSFYVAYDDLPMFRYQLEKGPFQKWHLSLSSSFFETKSTRANILTAELPYSYWVLDPPNSPVWMRRLTPELRQSLQLVSGRDLRARTYLYMKSARGVPL